MCGTGESSQTTKDKCSTVSLFVGSERGEGREDQDVKMKETAGDPGGKSKSHDEGWVQSKCICGNNKTLSVLTNLGFITQSSQLVSTLEAATLKLDSG